MLVQATSTGSYTGTVVDPIDFAGCSHPVGQVMWTLGGTGTSYTGTHVWVNANTCGPLPGGQSTWTITSTSSQYTLTFCTARPGSGAVDPSATPGHPAGTTLCYDLTRALAPTTGSTSSSSGSVKARKVYGDEG